MKLVVAEFGRASIAYYRGLSREAQWVLLGSAGSFVAHVLVFAVTQFYTPAMPKIPDEWEVAAEIVMDATDLAPAREEKPATAITPQPPVNTTEVLPVLPKTFTVPEEKQPEAKIPDKEPPKAVAEEKPIPEDNPKPPAEDRSKDNNLERDEALKRLALQRLVEANRKDPKLEDKRVRSIDLLKEAAAKAENASSGGDAQGKAEKYKVAVTDAVRRNFAVPEAYNLQNADIAVVIALRVTAAGDLQDVKIHKDSGDNAFDEMAMLALRNSTPLPAPPTPLVGELIFMQFTPKSF